MGYKHTLLSNAFMATPAKDENTTIGVMVENIML